MADLFELVRDIPAHQAAERQGLHLRQKGSRLWACCPLHGEKTPSMCFYPQGTWYCYGCHEGGDAVRFYQAYLNLSAYDAAVRLAEDFGIRIPEKNEQPTKPKATVYNLMMSWAAKPP